MTRLSMTTKTGGETERTSYRLTTKLTDRVSKVERSVGAYIAAALKS